MVDEGTSIQGLEHEEQKTEETRDSPSFDPHAIVIDGNRRNGIKDQQALGSERLNPHLTRSTGIENKRGTKKEWNPQSFDQLVMERTRVERKGMVPRSKPTHRAP
jgi:hypothetical protein